MLQSKNGKLASLDVRSRNKNATRNYTWRHGTEKGALYRARDAARKRAYRKTAKGKKTCSEYEKGTERKFRKKLRRCGL